MDCQAKRQTGRQQSNIQTVRKAGKQGGKHSENVCVWEELYYGIALVKHSYFFGVK